MDINVRYPGLFPTFGNVDGLSYIDITSSIDGLR